MEHAIAIKEHMLSGVRFLFIGLLGTIVHIGVVAWLVETHGIDPRLSNLFAFLVAFPVSYIGHYHVSFQSQHAHRGTLKRFALIACLGFLVGQTIMTLAISGSLSYLHGLIGISICVPLLSYLMNKFLVFQRDIDAYLECCR